MGSTMSGKPGLLQRFLSITLGQLFKWGLIAAFLIAVLGIIGFWLFVAGPSRTVPSYQAVDEYVYLGQGWGEQRNSPLRQAYYYTAQGTSMPQGSSRHALRYDWFVHLERPFSAGRFADPEHMRSYRFLVDAAPTEANPDQLPVGFSRHFDPNVGEYLLDITCAACHTGQIEYTKADKRYALRVDGGQAMHAFTDMSKGSFAPTLLASMIDTYFNPLKFNRFARNVLGERYPDGKSQLRKDFWGSIRGLLSMGQNNPLRHLYPVREGFGRTDALGRIANTVFGDHLTADNYRVADAPVSYPFLWNIWKFDWVQYNASVKQPLARNIGEAMGVGAQIRMLDKTGDPVPAGERYASSINIRNLVNIEHTLQQLQPPHWPEEILGPIDRPLAAQGKALFEENCQRCHGPHVASAAQQQAQAPGKPAAGLEWNLRVIPVERIGTDPNAAVGFVERRYDLSMTGLSDAEVERVLRPLLTRQLARDVRYRLTALIEAAAATGADVGALPELLAQYPDPDANVQPSLPRSSFAVIERELAQLFDPLPAVPQLETPEEPFGECGERCQLRWLLWSVTRGEAHFEHQLDTIDVTQLSEGQGLNILGLLVKEKFYREYGISYADQQCLEGFGTLDLPQQIAGYKPRPLAGVWATPPFLHNGSVPNLRQMLVPPEQRQKRFFVGPREFDPINVGYVTEPSRDDEKDGFWFDTSISGNHNTGHAFVATTEQWAQRGSKPLPPGVIGPLLSDDQRRALVEYLKIHRDDAPLTPADYQPPACGPWADQIVAQ